MIFLNWADKQDNLYNYLLEFLPKTCSNTVVMQNQNMAGPNLSLAPSPVSTRARGRRIVTPQLESARVAKAPVIRAKKLTTSSRETESEDQLYTGSYFGFYWSAWRKILSKFLNFSVVKGSAMDL